MLKVIIAGSRDWYPSLEEIDAAFAEVFFFDTALDGFEVVSGGARGADSAGENWARANQVPYRQFPAKWGEYGKGAGILRNQEMADYADAALVFWAGQSSGSANMVANMVARDKAVHVITSEQQMKKALAVKPEPVEDAPF